MNIVETLNEGLKRAYRLTIPAADIDRRIDAEVKAAAPNVRLPGFRPGKVPANLIRKMHGPALSQSALDTSVRESVQALIADKGLRPAMQPSVALEDGYAAGQDAALTVELEVLPTIPTPAIEGLTLERLTVPADDAAVDEAVGKLAAQMKRFEDAAEGHAAAMGDQVVVDFAGKVDGVAFDGGTGEGMAVELGSGQLIPGFEDQLVGATVGEARTLNVTFPENYGAKNLAGQAATFDVTVTAVKVAATGAPDDAFAQSIGLEGIDKLRDLMRGQVEQEHNGLTRTHMKRKLLDQLAASHDFDVPPSMVEAEFAQIMRQLEQEAAQADDAEAAKAELEAEREDYRAIAVRRVRLGLLLSEIGQSNGVEVSAQEMSRLVAQAAQQYRAEDRERFVQYVQQDAFAAAQLRAPLFEDKVVDFLLDKATITDREVTRAELEAAIEEDVDLGGGGTAHGEPGHVHGPDCDHGHDHQPAAEAAAPVKAKKTKKVDAGEEAPKPKKAKAKSDADTVPAEDGEAKAPKAKKAKKAAD